MGSEMCIRDRPKHSCIACRTHSAQAVPLPRLFPALSTRIPIGRPVALTWPVHTFQVRAGDSRVVREDLLWRDLYVRAGIVSTVPCTSSVAAVCRCELLPAVVFSRVAGAWLMVAGVCYSSVYSHNSLTHPYIGTHHCAAAEVAQKGRGEAV